MKKFWNENEVQIVLTSIGIAILGVIILFDMNGIINLI